MSNRYNVALAVDKEIITDKLREWLKDCDSVFDHETYYVFEWDSVKWTTFYPDVKGIEDFVNANCERSGLVVADGEFENLGSPSDYDLYQVVRIEKPENGKELNKENFFQANSIKLIENIDKE